MAQTTFNYRALAFVLVAACMALSPSSASITVNFPGVEARQVSELTSRSMLEPARLGWKAFHRVYQAEPKTVDVPSFSKNGLIGAMVMSYNLHHHLELRPDDVWLGVMTGFDALMNRGPPGGEPIAEALRPKVVDHAGKLTLTAFGGGSITTFGMDSMVGQITKQLGNLTKAGLADWAQPDFSTTTPMDVLVGRMTLMSGMQAYFEHTFVLLCGLPGVTLHGTPADWRRVRDKADKLIELDHPALTAWHARLAPVLDRLVDTSEGRADAVWWQRITHHISEGSGPAFLSGWANVFAPADTMTNGYVQDSATEYGLLDTSEVPSGVVSVPIEVDDNGVEYRTTLLAGFVGVGVSHNTTVRPVLGWQLLNADGVGSAAEAARTQ